MADGMAQTIKDPILQKIRDGVEEKIPPELKKDYQAVMVAGMKLMFDQSTHGFMVKAVQQIAQSGEKIPQMMAHAIVKLVSIIHNESKGRASIPALMAASIVFMCYAYEFMETTYKTPVTKDLVAQTSKLIVGALFKLFQIDAAKMKEAVQRGMPPPGATAVGQPAAAGPLPPAGAPPAASGVPMMPPAQGV